MAPITLSLNSSDHDGCNCNCMPLHGRYSGYMDRTMKTQTSLAFFAFLFLFANHAPAKSTKSTWLSGQVACSSVSGQGPVASTSSKAVNQRDIWWNYCIAADGLFYSVTSRQTPAKLGLKNRSLVKFFEKKNRIYILDGFGRRVSLTIIRKDTVANCP